MRKSAVALVLIPLPTVALAQGVVRVSSVYGPVDWKGVATNKYVPLQASTQTVSVGDEIRTGTGGMLTLELADASYMVISENTTLTIQEFWSPNLHSLINLMLGKVRFYIQRLGGKPNPYSVRTPTALIAVRGTIFEVGVDPSGITEVSCLEGRVAVESTVIHDREVILDQGNKTLVRPDMPPVMPVALNEPLLRNRVIPAVRKDAEDPTLSGKNTPSIERMIRDNDRRNRTSDPLQGPNSTTTTDTQRAKPTLRYPEL